jgi:hypothetical protein
MILFKNLEFCGRPLEPGKPAWPYHPQGAADCQPTVSALAIDSEETLGTAGQGSRFGAPGPGYSGYPNYYLRPRSGSPADMKRACRMWGGIYRPESDLQSITTFRGISMRLEQRRKSQYQHLSKPVSSSRPWNFNNSETLGDFGAVDNAGAAALMMASAM